MNLTDLSSWSWVFGHRMCYFGHCKCVLTINFQLPLINPGSRCFVVSGALPTIFGGLCHRWHKFPLKKPIEDWLIGVPIDLVIGNLDRKMWLGNLRSGKSFKKSKPTKTVDVFVHCRPSNHSGDPYSWKNSEQSSKQLISGNSLNPLQQDF